VAHFSEDHSGKTFDRPEFNKLMQLAEQLKKELDLVLVVRYDRFGRAFDEGRRYKAKLEKWGIDLQAIDQPLGRMGVPEDLVMEILYMSLPQVENDRRAKMTRAGMRRAMKEGWFMQHAPKGYKRIPYGDRTILSPNEDAPLVLESFAEAARCSLSIEAIRKVMVKKGLKISKNQFNAMLKNPVYKGCIPMRATEEEPESIVRGKHEAIVNEELFDRVQIRFQYSSRKGEAKIRGYHPKFYLRGFL
jgi:DNA invertase Pin-like site-specific DNA recombinase